MLQDVRSVTPQLMCAQQQLGEIDAAGTLAGLFVGAIDGDHLTLVRVTAVVQVLGSQALVLLLVDEPLRLTRRPFAVVQVHLADDPFDQALLIVRIHDLEALHQPGLLPMRAQQTVRQAMEGADPHATDRLAQQGLDTVFHLARCLVGEGHGEDAPGRQTLDLDQPGDTVHQHTRLAGSGARQHQGTANRRGHGGPLGVVQAIDNVRYVHRGDSNSQGH